MNSSSPTPSGAERAAAAAAESAAAYQKYVASPAPRVKDKVHEAKETVQVKADKLKQQAQAKADEVKQQAKAKADEVTQQAKAKADEVTQQAKAKADEVTQQAQSLMQQALGKLPPQVVARIEPLMATAKQRPLPTAAVTAGMLLVLRRLFRKNR